MQKNPTKNKYNHLWKYLAGIRHERKRALTGWHRNSTGEPFLTLWEHIEGTSSRTSYYVSSQKVSDQTSSIPHPKQTIAVISKGIASNSIFSNTAKSSVAKYIFPSLFTVSCWSFRNWFCPRCQQPQLFNYFELWKRQVQVNTWK